MPLVSINVPIANGKGQSLLKSHLRNLRQVTLETAMLTLTGADNINNYFTIKTNIPFMSENVNNADDRLVLFHDLASNTQHVEQHYDEVRYFNAEFKNDISVEIYDKEGNHTNNVQQCHLLFSYVK